MRSVFDKCVSLSIGVVEAMKTNKEGLVKYCILYKDRKGRKCKAWTNWMKSDRYAVGDHIPVKNIAIPSFGLINIPLTVSGHPQTYVEPYVAAIVLAGIGALIAGYNIGKNKK